MATRKRPSEGAATLHGIVDIRADHRPPRGGLLTGRIVAAVRRAEDLAATDELLDPSDQGLEDLYVADAERLQAAADRLAAWEARGCIAASGVATFYASPSAEDIDDSVAAMIFNETKGWLAFYALDDEAINDLYRTGGTSGRINLLPRMFQDRGPSAGTLASWDPRTE